MRLSPPDEPEWLYVGDWYLALPVLALGMHMQLQYTSLHGELEIVFTWRTTTSSQSVTCPNLTRSELIDIKPSCSVVSA